MITNYRFNRTERSLRLDRHPAFVLSGPVDGVMSGNLDPFWMRPNELDSAVVCCTSLLY
jgi:hypothetical protein